jgi:hypothetical protein
MKDMLYKKQLPSKDGFDITFYALVEYNSPIDVDGDDEDTRQQCKDIDDGKYVYFCAKITASKHGIELSSDCLGCCIYDWYDDFIEDDYCKDMIDTAIAEAKDMIKRLCEDV